MEGKYTVAPGLQVAVRLDRLDFGDIDDGSGNRLPWDDPVQRWEYGLGYHLRDGVIAKFIRQDVRAEQSYPDERTAHEHFHAIQLSVSF